MNTVVAEPVNLNDPVDIQDAKEQMIEIAVKKYKNIEPIKDKDSLEDCFTEEYGKLYFWFNVPMGTKHGTMGATKTLTYDLKKMEELVPASCSVTSTVKKLHRKETGKGEWALVSSKNPSKILKWFGTVKPSESEIEKEDNRVKMFKNLTKGYTMNLENLKNELEVLGHTDLCNAIETITSENNSKYNIMLDIKDLGSTCKVHLYAKISKNINIIIRNLKSYIEDENKEDDKDLKKIKKYEKELKIIEDIDRKIGNSRTFNKIDKIEFSIKGLEDYAIKNILTSIADVCMNEYKNSKSDNEIDDISSKEVKKVIKDGKNSAKKLYDYAIKKMKELNIKVSQIYDI